MVLENATLYLIQALLIQSVDVDEGLPSDLFTRHFKYDGQLSFIKLLLGVVLAAEELSGVTFDTLALQLETLLILTRRRRL